MKYTLLILLIVVTACKQAKETATPSEQTEVVQLADFEWLEGKWQRTNEDQGKQTFENWEKISEQEYKGLGYTLQAGDTVFLERITLRHSGDNWTFEVLQKGAKVATVFELTEITNNSFICKNDQNDFPKEIQYIGRQDQLNAIISGEDVMIPFDFKRL